jgi:tRNA(Ile2)-agmatinylcytidine synthase
MTVVALDDTDAAGGMCTTYVAARVAARLRERGAAVDRCLLVRLNPAVEHKTRGNAALAVHTDADPAAALAVARDAVDEFAEVDAEGTNPGVVVAAHAPAAVPRRVADWTRRAMHERLAIGDAVALAEDLGYRHEGWGLGRGRVGALAAVGAPAAFEDWTAERIAYRERDRWGTPRAVDHDAVHAAAAAETPPATWDTVDRTTGATVCVPNTPCPVLLGVRGDDPDAVERVVERGAREPGGEDGAAAPGVVGSAADDPEPVTHAVTFHTNQGTDAHLQRAALADASDGGAYRVDGVVAAAPETRAGGHVHLTLRDGATTLPAVAFEPTGRFRDRVRALRPGDRVTACGEVADGTLKLEKFAVRSLAAAGVATPRCPVCGATTSSAGAGQGYRCRDCGTATAAKPQAPAERSLERGWYEVPPGARRHVAKPLVRGGFGAPVHPET